MKWEIQTKALINQNGVKMWNKKIDVNLKKKVNINEIIELCMRKCFSDKKNS